MAHGLLQLDKLIKPERLRSFNDSCTVVQERHRGRHSFLGAGVLGCSAETGEGVEEVVDFMKSGGVWRDEYFLWEEEEGDKR